MRQITYLLMVLIFFSLKFKKSLYWTIVEECHSLKSINYQHPKTKNINNIINQTKTRKTNLLYNIYL